MAYALGAEAYARQILFDDWNRPESRVLDTLTEPWAVPAVPFDIEAGTLELSIEDLDRRFNLNSLAGEGSSKNLTRFKTLLGSLGLDPVVADAWRDWVDADGEAAGFGAEDGAYLVATPPFRTANQPAGSTSELALLSLLDADQLARLLPYVTALPTTDTEDQRQHGERALAGVVVAARVAEPNRNAGRIRSPLRRRRRAR